MTQSPANGETDQENKIFRSAEPAGGERADLPARTNLPAPPPTLKGKSARKRWLRVALVIAVVVGGAGAGFYWWKHSQSQLPPGIAWGNGRIDADAVSYTHLRAHETVLALVCRLLLEKQNSKRC